MCYGRWLDSVLHAIVLDVALYAPWHIAAKRPPQYVPGMLLPNPHCDTAQRLGRKHYVGVEPQGGWSLSGSVVFFRWRAPSSVLPAAWPHGASTPFDGKFRRDEKVHEAGLTDEIRQDRPARLHCRKSPGTEVNGVGAPPDATDTLRYLRDVPRR